MIPDNSSQKALENKLAKARCAIASSALRLDATLDGGTYVAALVTEQPLDIDPDISVKFWPASGAARVGSHVVDSQWSACHVSRDAPGSVERLHRMRGVGDARRLGRHITVRNERPANRPPGGSVDDPTPEQPALAVRRLVAVLADAFTSAKGSAHITKEVNQ